MNRTYVAPNNPLKWLYKTLDRNGLRRVQGGIDVVQTRDRCGFSLQKRFIWCPKCKNRWEIEITNNSRYTGYYYESFKSLNKKRYCSETRECPECQA